jgi:hypothetical protein
MLIQAHKRKTFRDTLLGGKTVRQSHVVELGDEVYRFIANDAGHSVCEVTDEAHIKRHQDRGARGIDRFCGRRPQR